MIGAVAENCTRTSSVAGRHSAFKSQPRKLRSPGASLRSGALPFQQRTNTSCYLAIPTHGFTVVLSVFRGTPPAKPLNCKSVSNRLGARIRPVWTHHAGGTPRHSCDRFRLALSDIIKTSFSFHSQFRLPFVPLVNRHIFRQQKTLLTRGKQGYRNPIFDSYLLTFPLSKLDSGVRPLYGLDSLRLNAQPWLARL